MTREDICNCQPAKTSSAQGKSVALPSN